MAGLDKPKVVVVCGPTATGKTKLALALARHFGGEVISADSMQIYRGLCIGTAAVTLQEAAGVPVHLSGVLPPEQPFSVAQWLDAAREATEEVLVRGALPVLCGGTGLYLQSIVRGTSFAEKENDPALRARLEEEWRQEGAEAMWQKLHRVDPARAARLHQNDQKRILRALEAVLATGRTAEEREKASRPQDAPYQCLVLGLDYPSREMLYAAINRRVDAMVEQGLLGEAKLVWENRASYRTAAQAIGYKEFFPYFEEAQPLDVCVDKLKQATRNYAKRQLTWFRNMPEVQWLMADDADLEEKATAKTRAFLQP